MITVHTDKRIVGAQVTMPLVKADNSIEITDITNAYYPKEIWLDEEDLSALQMQILTLKNNFDLLHDIYSVSANPRRMQTLVMSIMEDISHFYLGRYFSMILENISYIDTCLANAVDDVRVKDAVVAIKTMFYGKGGVAYC